MSNLDLWKSVEKTDPAHTKKVTQRGGYTSISPQYQLKEATDKFGPYGMGFGFESIEFDYSQVELTKLVLVKAVFFYMLRDMKITFPIMNSWSLMQGTKVDSDFAKKAETNTMSKALSKLGFSADVFMGQFDDPEYVGMIRNEVTLENAEDKIEETRRQKNEYESKCKKELEFIASATSLNELQKLYTDYIRRASLRDDKAQISALTSAKDKRKGEL